MGVNRNFYKLQSFFSLKSVEIFIGIIPKRNFKLPAIFNVVTSSGHKMKYVWELHCLNLHVRVFLNHDAGTMRDIIIILKQP